MTVLGSDQLKIIVCCHKPCRLPQSDYFLPVHVGAALSAGFGMQRDDEVYGRPCDNISARNRCYCELTALYWAWKNLRTLYPNVRYVGVNHYRRFFAFDRRSWPYGCFFRSESDLSEYAFDAGRVSRILHSGGSILASARHFPYSNAVHYAVSHVSDDFRALQRVIFETYPGYRDAFVRSMLRSGRLSPYNMFIVSWEQYNSYCAWLFDVLARVEERIDACHRDGYQGRALGFLGERLLNVWFCENVSSVRHVPIYEYRDDKVQVGIARQAFRNIRCDLGCTFSRPLRDMHGI